jgi:cobalamin biosynthesis protein CobT
MRESTPKTTKIFWELSKVAQTSQDPSWVAVRTTIHDYVRIYGDDIMCHDKMRVLEITDEEMEARCGPDLPVYPPGLWQKLKDIRDRHAIQNKLREKMNDRALFGPSSDDELSEDADASEENFEDYDSRSGDESTELEAHDEDY